MSTYQDLFNRSVKGVASQGFQRATVVVNGVETCRYRAPDGKKCAIGHLIEDREYCSEFEGCFVVELLGKVAVVDYAVTTTFLTELQKAHDRARDADEMKTRLRYVARFYNLELPAELAE